MLRSGAVGVNNRRFAGFTVIAHTFGDTGNPLADGTLAGATVPQAAILEIRWRMARWRVPLCHRWREATRIGLSSATSATSATMDYGRRPGFAGVTGAPEVRYLLSSSPLARSISPVDLLDLYVSRRF